MKEPSNELRIMTFNVRQISDPPPNSWGERQVLISKLLAEEKPDIIGTQECLFQQVKDMLAILPDYDWVGLGRKGGSAGEFMAIYYKRSRFDVLEYDHYWLSATPLSIGSTTWGNTIPRMVTWARFLDKQTGKSFYLINTHLDHRSEEARIEGARLIAEKAADLDEELPVLLTGDFNIGEDSEPYRYLVNEGGFADTWYAAHERINDSLGTFNGFINETGGWTRIDWILMRGSVTVSTSRIINTHYNGLFPSDHFPVMAVVKLEK